MGTYKVLLDIEMVNWSNKNFISILAGFRYKNFIGLRTILRWRANFPNQKVALYNYF